MSFFASGTTSSAAADGVGARRSATKSQMVKSVSCPTAETIGISERAISLAKASSLKAHKSSIEPPPLATIKTSHKECSLNFFIALEICAAAPSPCTSTGKNTISASGKRRFITFWMSQNTAPVSDVTTPTL